MRDEFEQYIISLYKDIPQEVYEDLLSVFCLVVVLFVAFKGIRTGFRWSSVLLLIEYIFLLFYSTVIFRPTGEARQYDYHPFWSYNRPELLVANIMNVIVFIPIGMILGSLLRVKGSWLVALLIGCSISITIEALLFWFMKGFSEVDDVMHNTLGCILGYILVQGSRLMTQGLKYCIKA